MKGIGDSCEFIRWHVSSYSDAANLTSGGTEAGTWVSHKTTLLRSLSLRHTEVMTEGMESLQRRLPQVRFD